MPTGVALRDPRQQLLVAAQRLVARDGISGLTSRNVTAEAGVAKGVLHRYFADFDAFLVALVLERIATVRAEGAALQSHVGEKSVTENVAQGLVALLDPVMVATAGLVIARDEVRDRLRAMGTSRLPLVGEATAVLADYLAAERAAGRLAPHADVDALAPMLIGTVYLLATARADRTPPIAAVRRTVESSLAGLVP